jgi:hypothetical protein
MGPLLSHTEALKLKILSHIYQKTKVSVKGPSSNTQRLREVVQLTT